MKFRPQRGGLAEAMAEVREIEPTTEALSKLLRVWGLYPEITVSKYVYDRRIDWDTYLVCVDGRAVGFTDGPLKDCDNTPSEEIL